LGEAELCCCGFFLAADRQASPVGRSPGQKAEAQLNIHLYCRAHPVPWLDLLLGLLGRLAAEGGLSTGLALGVNFGAH
jgi:hypothetical protein